VKFCRQTLFESGGAVFIMAPSQKIRARVTRVDSSCAENSTFSYFDGTNPIAGKGIQLGSPTLIMAPVNSVLGFDSKHLCDHFSAFNKY